MRRWAWLLCGALAGCAAYSFNQLEGPGQISLIETLFGQRVVFCARGASPSAPPRCRDASDAPAAPGAEDAR